MDVCLAFGTEEIIDNKKRRSLVHFHGALGYLRRKYKNCIGKSSKRLIRWQRHLRSHVYFCGALPKRKIYTVRTCQFGILCSIFEVYLLFFFFFTAFLPEVLVFSFSIILKNASIHRLFMESTSFLTFCGGISSGPGDRFSKSRKVFAPGKPQQSFEPYDYRAVLFMWS